MEGRNCGPARLLAGSRGLPSPSTPAGWEMGEGARLSAGRKAWERDKPLPLPDFHHRYWRLGGQQLLEATVLLEAVNQGENVE